MIKEKLVPKRRFKEFENNDAWEQRKLMSIVEFNPKGDIPDTFKYVDLESVIGTEIIDYREEKKGTAPSRAQRLARQGDLFYQTVRPYQKNNYLFEKPYNNYVFSTGYAQMRPHGDGYFLLSLMQNNLFVKLVLDRCTGTGYPAISSSDLADMEVFIPANSNEQTQIGVFFKNYDNLITLHQRKLKKLEEIKSAYLSEMFPKEGENVPKLRFTGFNKPWKYIELENIMSLRGGYSFKSNNFRENGIPIVRITNVLPNGTVGGEFAFHPEIYNDADLLLPDNSLVLAMSGATTGKISVVDNPKNKKIYQNQRVGYFLKKSIVEHYYIYNMLKSDLFKNQLQGVLITGAQPNISPKEINGFIFPITNNIEEQIEIGEFFKNLDNQIKLNEEKLKKLKELKESYLNEMFV